MLSCPSWTHTYDSLVRQVDAASEVQRRERGAGLGYDQPAWVSQELAARDAQRLQPCVGPVRPRMRERAQGTGSRDADGLGGSMHRVAGHGIGRDLAMAEMPTSVYLTFQYRLRAVRLEQPFASCSRPSSAAHTTATQTGSAIAGQQRISVLQRSRDRARLLPCLPVHSWQAFRLRSTSDDALVPMIESVSSPTAHTRAAAAVRIRARACAHRQARRGGRAPL